VADVQPFRGLRYNKSLTRDLSQVFCPPYDIISPAFHEELHNRSEYNFIRLEDAKTFPQDTPSDNKYTRAAEMLKRWLEQHILIAERKPAVYIHDHYFKQGGKEQVRRGIIARVRLEEWERGVIKPHEGILGPARDDRLSLLWALQINTSPVLAMFQDSRKQISTILENQDQLKPLFDATVPEGDRHVIRAITDVETLAQLTKQFEEKPLYIADGHHRYTSALTYRREQASMNPSFSPEAAFNFVMMTLVSFTDPGLVILAPHRLIRGIEKSVIDSLETQLAEFFDINKLPLDKPGLWQKIDKFMKQESNVRFVCFTANSNHLSVLTLKEHAIDGQTMPLFHSELYRKLDVSVIDHIILEKILGLGIGGSDESKISYFYDREDALNRVLKGEYQLAFFLKPVKPELIKAVADANDKMPRKSTYFYPKAPAGLVVNRLKD
jgi:uncharacterized protein (DUF1015 family)